MPDIIFIATKRWKFIFGLTLAATVLAFVISLFRPKEYLATATALPANSMAADKGRIFNSNIESLYPEIGTPDELDRIEGTARLDTLFLAIADSLDLATHYNIDRNSSNVIYKSAMALKKNTDIRRSAYGELKIKVWDGDALLAAQLANALLSKLNGIHQHIQNANNTQILQKLGKELEVKEQQADSLETDMVHFQTGNSIYNPDGDFNRNKNNNDSVSIKPSLQYRHNAAQARSLNEQIKEYYKIISQYELAVGTNPHVLIPVENARPPISPDKPKILQTVLFAFGASFIFSFLLVLLVEGRKEKL